MHLIFRLIRLLTLNYRPFRKKQELLVVLFHQVNDKPLTFYPAVPTRVYQEMCLFLKKHYEIIHFAEVEKHYQSNPKKPAAIITFDDGMYDIVEHVLPFMESQQLKFNINIDTEILETKLPQDFLRVYDILNQSNTLTEYMDETYLTEPIKINYVTPIVTENEFTAILSNLNKVDKRKFTLNMHKKLTMNPDLYSRVISDEQLSILAKNKLVEIGSHSHSHSVLTKINTDSASYELAHSKQILEKITQQEIPVFAYPNGASSELTDQLAYNLGYKYLLKTDDKTTHINKNFNFKAASYYRINQYHQNTELALAHTFGVIQKMKKLLKK